MARLNHDESLALVRAFVRGQNLLKGCALDCARMALPETPGDRQFTALTKAVKDKEQALRTTFMRTMVEVGLIEELTNEELFNVGMK
jgi:hypothetical protein